MYKTIQKDIEQYRPISYEFLINDEHISDLPTNCVCEIWKFIRSTITDSEEIIHIEFNKNSNIGLLLNKILNIHTKNYVKTHEILCEYFSFNHIHFMDFDFILYTEIDIEDKISLLIHTSKTQQFLRKLSNKHLNKLY